MKKTLSRLALIAVFNLMAVSARADIVGGLCGIEGCMLSNRLYLVSQ
ncbi:MAG: hypothetical protein J6W56_06890 [Prevotella sp.]|nr:hypothetical protein [Prevotella sp.]